MEKNEYRLKGHESFALREGWLTKGLIAVHNNSAVFSKNHNYGADALGIGTNMAKSVRYWLKAAGLTNESIKNGTTLTPLGKLVYDNDIYIEDIFTLWLVHINIVRNFRQATSWNVFFNYIDVNRFTIEELVSLMTRKLTEITEISNLPERSIRDDCAAIRTMYTESDASDIDPEDRKISPFAELGLIWTDGKQYGKQSPVPGTLDPLLVLYIMSDKLNSCGYLKIDDVVDGPNMPGKVLNLNRVVVNEYLDMLQNEGYITVNRTAGLDMVYVNEESMITEQQIISNHYKGTDAE